MDNVVASQVRRHLEEKVIDYWHDVDFHWGVNASEHYTENGLFTGKGIHYEGRDEIKAFYAWRRNRGERVNVHLVGNFTCKFSSDDEANVTWICFLYAKDGVAPQPSEAPISISRVEDTFVRTTSGEWLCSKREWNQMFKGDAPTTRMSRDAMDSATSKNKS